MAHMSLSPAYGRDYKTKAEVIAAFEADKDFCGDITTNFQYVNKSQLKEIGVTSVQLRYKQLRSVTVHTVN